MTWRRLIILLVAVNGCFSGVEHDRATGRLDAIEALKHRLSSVRGLKFANEVPISVEQEASIRKHIETRFQEDIGSRKPEDVSLAYAKLGLLPKGVDLGSSLLSYYSSHISGFYDSRTKKIVLLQKQNADMSQLSLVPRGADMRVLVHELTHALQDQHFGLASRLGPSDNGDKLLALRSVAEGDAVLTEYAYSFGGLHEWVPGYVLQVLNGARQDAIPSDIPMLVADKARFQYLAGARFVTHFVGQNGWLPVNLLYQYPPLSTEQILHPEKYFEVPDPPTRIDLKNLSSLFSSEWREIEKDTLGELLVQCLFNQVLPPAEAAAVANGWDGDRFVAYRNGDEIAFIWATVWDSPKDSAEFYQQYQKILSIKYGTPVVDSRFYIERRDRSVLVVEGLNPDQVRRNIEAIWNGMVLEEEKFQPPPFSSWISSR